MERARDTALDIQTEARLPSRREQGQGRKREDNRTEGRAECRGVVSAFPADLAERRSSPAMTGGRERRVKTISRHAHVHRQ